MASFSFKQAFGREKPHSSVTDWVEILSGSNVAEESYDGVPELVEAINLQVSGPTEAARAIRKKLKHGNVHQQYRALVLMKALVENCGAKFHNCMRDTYFMDALRVITRHSTVDKRVNRKLMAVLSSWRDQYKDDPNMAFVASLYQQFKTESKNELALFMGVESMEDEAKIKREEKLAAKEKSRKEEEERKAQQLKQIDALQQQGRRPRFDFERDKPKVLNSIIEASQASSNLSNAMTLVNPDNDRYDTNERVQECLTKARAAQKTIVRYIRLVEKEELIGTLIESNDRINGTIENCEQLTASQTDSLTSQLYQTHISPVPGENSDSGSVSSPRGNSNNPHKSYVHPDLEDLSFGQDPLSDRLPPPLRPSSATTNVRGKSNNPYDRGTLAEYSDYESSDEETHRASTSRKTFVQVLDNEGGFEGNSKKVPLSVQDDDPFADPFADEQGTSSKMATN